MSDQDLFDVVDGEIDELIAEIAAAKKDGQVTWGELFGILYQATTGLVTICQKVAASGDAKRHAVVKAVMRLWDEHLVQLDLPGPDAILDPALRAAIPGIVDKIITGCVWWNKLTVWKR